MTDLIKQLTQAQQAMTKMSDLALKRKNTALAKEFENHAIAIYTAIMELKNDTN